MRQLALVLVVLSAHAAAADPSSARKRNVLLTVSTGTLYLLSETALNRSLSPGDCRWCTPPSIDIGARNALVWRDVHSARTASDVVAHLAVPVFAISAVNLTLVGRDAGWNEVLDGTLPVLESVFASQILTNFVKGAVGRERPDRHFGRLESAGAEDKNVSFWSGHTSLAFAFVTSAGVVARMRRSRGEPFIWGIGLTLATAAGYLRIAGDKHYLTDVVVGAGVGIAAGYLVPRLMQRGLAITSSGHNVILVGSF